MMIGNYCPPKRFEGIWSSLLFAKYDVADHHGEEKEVYVSQTT